MASLRRGVKLADRRVGLSLLANKPRGCPCRELTPRKFTAQMFTPLHGYRS